MTKNILEEDRIVQNEKDFNAPYDNTSKNYKCFSQDLDIPDHEIVAVDSEYLCTRHSFFRFREGFSNYTNNKFVILDNENKEIFSCKIKDKKAIVFDKFNSPIINTTVDVNAKHDKLSDKLLINENIKISKGKESKNSEYGIMKASFKLKRYSLLPVDTICYQVEFLNLISNREERMEIRVLNENTAIAYLWRYYIYCNPGEENETLICKIARKKSSIRDYIIEVAPRVDYMYMISICLSLCKCSEIYQTIITA